jgi:hypothetical protein
LLAVFGLVGLCIMAAMSAGDCESMSPISVIPLVFVGTTLGAGADAALRPVGFNALAATVTAGGTCPSPNRIMPLFCNRPMIGGGATGPIGVRAGLLVVFLLATGFSFHRSAGTPLRRWMASACLTHFFLASSRLALLPAV